VFAIFGRNSEVFEISMISGTALANSTIFQERLDDLDEDCSRFIAIHIVNVIINYLSFDLS